MIEKLDKKTGEIVRLVNQFFNMAKLESGDTILHIQRLNVGQICREIMLEYFDILEQKKCEVRIQIPDKPIYADVDSEALSRILKNLIDNAIKYGYDGKFLGITVKEAAQVIMIEIEDRGKGIKDSEKELIFERTFALGNKHKHGTQSNGIGLSISRNLAKQMGADISVSSQPDFKTIFTIKLSKN